MSQDNDGRWVGSWATTPDPIEGVELAGQTVRMIARLSIGGGSLRVRLSNAYGAHDLPITAASIGFRADGATVLPGSVRPLTLNGARSTVIAAGAVAVSDPVEVNTAPLSDVAISVYLPDALSAAFRITGHNEAHQTGYISEPGDFTSADDLPVQQTIEKFLFVSGIEVLAPHGVGGIVAFGDSLTEGNISRLDANHRWPDQLARRLAARHDGRQLGVVNQGLGGNRLLHDGRGDNALRRFDRDVLAQPGATHVIILIGVNDFRNSRGKTEEVATVEAMLAEFNQLIVRARSVGIKVYGGTLLPWKDNSFNGCFYTAEGEAVRQAVNKWIREGSAFDSVIDFEAALRDPNEPDRMSSEWDSGDHLHPSDPGYLRMGDCIDLVLFD